MYLNHHDDKQGNAVDQSRVYSFETAPVGSEKKPL